MQITDEAKEIITIAMDSNNCNCLKVTQQNSCCGTSLYFGLGKLEEGETPVLINGVSVLMDDQTQERAEKVTVAFEGGKLQIVDDAPSGC